MKTHILLILLLFYLNNICGQSKKYNRYIDSTYYLSIIDSLNNEFGENKQFNKKYKLQIIIALSFYPELKKIKISFLEKSISTTMNCRPTICSVFKKRNNKYKIRFNNRKKFEGISFEDIPFNAQIGIIGHELAHITDYENSSTFGIIKKAFSYLFKKKKAKFEKYIDKLTIEHLLAWQLYDWSYYAIYKSKASKKYKKFKSEIYLKPSEIKKIINK